MKKKYVAPKIEIIKVETGCHLLVGSGGNANYNVGDPTTPTTSSKPTGDGISGGISAGGDDDDFEGLGSKNNNIWGNWND